MTLIQIKISEKIIPTASTTFTPGTIPYMHKEDEAIRGNIRSCAPCPAVWVLRDDSHNFVTKQWQYYAIAINYNMPLEDVYFLFDNNLAFCNESGLRNRSDPRQDWFHNRDLTEKPPNFDKVRTCSRNCVTGVEVFSTLQAIKDTARVLWNFKKTRQGVMQDVRNVLGTTTNVLKVKTFDSRHNPPLKPGRIYPRTIAEINPDDYLYMPRYNREMFLVANIVNRSGEVVQFPRGGLYPWTKDGTPYTFLPHISNPDFGEVRVPLDRFTKLAQDAVVPSPYRSN